MNEIVNVKYEHYRLPNYMMFFFKKDKGKPNEDYLARFYRGNVPNGWRGVYEYGGKTVCTIETENGQTVTGQALCSMSDQFCYATGRKIAYGRTLKKLNSKYAKSKLEIVIIRDIDLTTEQII